MVMLVPTATSIFYCDFGANTSIIMVILEPEPPLLFIVILEPTHLFVYCDFGANTTSMFMVSLEPEPLLFCYVGADTHLFLTKNVMLQPKTPLCLLFWSQNHFYVYGYCGAKTTSMFLVIAEPNHSYVYGSL